MFQSSEAAPVDQVHLVKIILVIHTRTVLTVEIHVGEQLAALIAVGLIPNKVLAALLVVSETQHIALTVLTGLPCARLPVLLIVAAPVQALDAATVIAALASLLLRVDLKDEVHCRLVQPEPTVSTAVRAVALRLVRAAAAAGVLSILGLLRHRAPPLVR